MTDIDLFIILRPRYTGPYKLANAKVYHLKES